ncbi:hypothetical protein NDU88_003613 [Pleurodeles waltl]|uniref:Uncharacterized protein n=1 Tax=Pleurodeles waltl TaxID=8319 RepID=A0AAV7TRS0_PLEWA|nr:hypothetical protein NDU88_003613 [Pleurodeles waltl]
MPGPLACAPKTAPHSSTSSPTNNRPADFFLTPVFGLQITDFRPPDDSDRLPQPEADSTIQAARPAPRRPPPAGPGRRAPLAPQPRASVRTRLPLTRARQATDPRGPGPTPLCATPRSRRPRSPRSGVPQQFSAPADWAPPAPKPP